MSLKVRCAVRLHADILKRRKNGENMADIKFSEFIQKPCSTCGFGNMPLDELPLTMSYTPMQKIGETYSEHDALMRGTLFPELDKPFKGKFTEARR